jgi:hypothetical protein
MAVKATGDRRNGVLSHTHRSNSNSQCFVNPRRHRHEHHLVGRCQICTSRVATTAAAVKLGKETSNSSSYPSHPHPYGKATKRTKPQIPANDDDANNSIMQLKFLEAQNVEVQLLDAVHKMNRIRQGQRILPMDQKIVFPSVRQCNAGKCDVWACDDCISISFLQIS